MMNSHFRYACCGLLFGIAATAIVLGGQIAAAQPSPTDAQKKCDYTYIEDSEKPNIGKNGEIKYNDAWKAVVEGGWTLKTSSSVGSTRVMYVFEKCG